MANDQPVHDYVSDDQGRVYEVLGSNDTRTATHYLYRGRAYPVGRSEQSSGRDGT